MDLVQGLPTNSNTHALLDLTDMYVLVDFAGLV